MSFLSKLFGRKSSEAPSPPGPFSPDEFMPEDRFWALVDDARERARGNRARLEQALAEVLRALTPAEANAFYNRFTLLKHAAYTWPLWAAAYIMQGGCSDDSFSDFRAWLIGEGQIVFEAALADPESLSTLPYDPEEDEWEGLGYVPLTVRREKCGAVAFANYPHPSDPTGEEWTEEELPQRYSKLWAKYG